MCNEDYCVDTDGTTTTGTTTSSTTESTTTSTTTGTTDTTGVDTTGADASTSGTTGTESGGPTCGDGEIDIGEECDDGNDVNGDGCNNDCVESGKLLWSVNVSTIYDLEDRGHGVAVDSQGSIFVAGTIKTAALSSARDIWVGKFTSDGAKIWEKTYDGAGASYDLDLGWDVAVDSNDQAVVVGSTDTGAQELNWWIRKYTSGGNTVWTVEEDFGVQEQAFGVVVQPSDEILVAGHSGNLVARVRKYTSGGNLIWNETFQVVGNTGEPDIALGPNGTFGLAGGGATKWVVKYDATPTQLWDFSEFGACTSLYGVAVDDDGHVFGAGCNDGSVWLKKLDGNDGSELWSDLAYQGIQNNYAIAYGATIDSVGAVIITGFETHNTEGENTFVRKYSSDGMLYWSRTYNGADSLADAGYGVNVGGADNVVVTGWETVIGEDKNIWLAKYTR